MSLAIVVYPIEIIRSRGKEIYIIIDLIKGNDDMFETQNELSIRYNSRPG